MAVDNRHSQPDLKELAERAQSIDFYELLRQLERSGKRFGRRGGVDEDPARLGQPIRMAFATSEIENMEVPEDGSSPKVLVNAVGLFGPEGPMPIHLTKRMLDRASSRWFAGEHSGATSDTAFHNFANLLQHRMIAFYWRAWADTRAEVQFAHGTGGGVGSMVRALAGIGLREPEADGFPASKLLHATSLFQRVESPRRLVDYVSAEIGHPVELIEFVGVWNDIPGRLQTRLGHASARLGVDAVVGRRFFDRTNRAELRIGPLDFATYTAFIETPDLQDALRHALRFVSGGAMQFDVRLLLADTDVPKLRMDSVRLGQTAWIGGADEILRGDFVMRNFVAEAQDLAA